MCEKGKLAKKELSRYEIYQVEKFILDLKKEYGIKLNWDDYRAEAWIAYLEMKNGYKYEKSTSFYWEQAEKYILKHLEQVIKERNRGFNQYNTSSLNKTSENYREEVGTLCRDKNGDFVNKIAWRDFIRRLGKTKCDMVGLLYAGEDDRYIMRKLHVDEKEYFKLRKELQKDFFNYIYKS